MSLNNLAGLLQNTNRLVETEPLFRRALAIDEKSFGPEHPAVARDLSNLAGLYYRTNRLAEAETLTRRMVEIFLKFMVSMDISIRICKQALRTMPRCYPKWDAARRR